MSDWIGLAQTLLGALLLAASFAMVFEGTRRLAGPPGFSRLAALLVAVGLLAPVVEGAASLRYARSVQLLTGEVPALQAQEPAGGWEAAPLGAAERTARSTGAAQVNYLVSGRLGQVIDATGARVPFVPTPQDLRDRENLVRGQKGAEDTIGQFLERGIRLLGSAAAFLLLGLALGAAERRRVSGRSGGRRGSAGDPR